MSRIEFVCKDWSKYVESLLPFYDVVINDGDKACTFGALSANSKSDNYYFSTRERNYVLLTASNLRTIADKLDELNGKGANDGNPESDC